jgi:hypothetical protein
MFSRTHAFCVRPNGASSQTETSDVLSGSLPAGTSHVLVLAHVCVSPSSSAAPRQPPSWPITVPGAPFSSLCPPPPSPFPPLGLYRLQAPPPAPALTSAPVVFVGRGISIGKVCNMKHTRAALPKSCCISQSVASQHEQERFEQAPRHEKTLCRHIADSVVIGSDTRHFASPTRVCRVRRGPVSDVVQQLRRQPGPGPAANACFGGGAGSGAGIGAGVGRRRQVEGRWAGDAVATGSFGQGEVALPRFPRRLLL